MTAQEYLEWEAQQEGKHEFHDGQVWAMAGASANHNWISTALPMYIGPQILSKGCRPFGPDARVATKRGDYYCYPDFTIVCGEPVFEKDVFDTLRNPKVIVEVLSPSTERYDRGLKFEAYSEIESLTDYILISQDKVRVEHFTKSAEGWLLVISTDIDSDLYIRSIGVSVSLKDLYAKVEFPTNPNTQ